MMEEIRKLISEGRTVTITVKGNSMNPFMVHLRDQMTLGPWKKEDIRRGTVALVKDRTGNHLIHRIMQVRPEGVILQGDGNVRLVETATWDNIIGIIHEKDFVVDKACCCEDVDERQMPKRMPFWTDGMMPILARLIT